VPGFEPSARTKLGILARPASTRTYNRKPNPRARFRALAASAIDYIDNRLPDRLNAGDDADWKMAVKVREAEVLFNIAANSSPVSAPTPPAMLKMALHAASAELAIRTELKQTPQMGRSNWVLGELNVRAGELVAAKGYLSTSLELATQADDQPTIAWAKVYLAKVLERSDPASAQRVRREGLELARSLLQKGFNDMSYLISTGEADSGK
jgi:hypothetical protein